MYNQEGAHKAPDRRGIPGVPRMTRAAIQLPPLSPSGPVRTQVFRPSRPGGRWLAAAYGPRVEGPDPVDNADERRIPRGGSPQESSIRRGQRPSVHRLHRCRRPKGPRASGATAAPSSGERRAPLQQMISHRGGCGARGVTHTRPRKRIHQAGKVAEERDFRLISTHTPRPPLSQHGRYKPSVPGFHFKWR